MKKVRLYRFYNINLNRHGEEFPLCDDCKKIYIVPNTCIMEKVTGETKLKCNLCCKMIIHIIQDLER